MVNSDPLYFVPWSWLLASFAIAMELYEFWVRRINLLRFLFGMKPSSRRPNHPLLKFVLAALIAVPLCFGPGGLLRRLPYAEKVL